MKENKQQSWRSARCCDRPRSVDPLDRPALCGWSQSGSASTRAGVDREGCTYGGDMRRSRGGAGRLDRSGMSVLAAVLGGNEVREGSKSASTGKELGG